MTTRDVFLQAAKLLEDGALVLNNISNEREYDAYADSVAQQVLVMLMMGGVPIHTILAGARAQMTTHNRHIIDGRSNLGLALLSMAHP